MAKRSQIAAILLVTMAAGCAAQHHATVDTPVQARRPVSHPFLLCSAAELPALRAKEKADPMLHEWLADMRSSARPASIDRRSSWQRRLENMAFVAMLDDDATETAQAIDELRQALRQRDPVSFFEHETENWYGGPPRAFALAWDFLEPRMTAAEKAELLPLLEQWCIATFEHTEKQWWRDACYNVGADPVGGNGLLALSLLHDSSNPAIEHCYRECVRRMGDNYFPTVWKPSGICYEGPGYAKAGLNEAIVFANAVLRGGGDDITANSGAPWAMKYLMYEYMPTGGCASIGDNTNFGPATFVAQYLLGLGKTRDAAGLWAWRKYANPRRVDSLIAYVWYPTDLVPVDPRQAALPTSHYFEVTPNRAGYVFSRTAWDDPMAAFFAFTTRFEQCNHQHYDMDSFVFGGFGTTFATHKMLFPYASDRHGVDYEHNIIVINGGGWPAYNRQPRSCGTDNSTEGLLVGMVLSNFADYVRGDAKASYHDNSLPTGEPAVRAERTCLFVKQGPTPYLLILDDNQQSGSPVKYEWLWHAPTVPMHGNATLEDPLVMAGKDGCCALQFITPAKPVLTTQPALEEHELDLRPPRQYRRPSSRPSTQDTTNPTGVSAAPINRETVAPATGTAGARASAASGREVSGTPPASRDASSKTPIPAATAPPATLPTSQNRQEPIAAAAMPPDEMLRPEPPPSTNPTSRPAYEIRPSGLTRLRVIQTGVRVHYAALASLQTDESARPQIAALPVSCEVAAGAVRVALSDGDCDVIAWQSEEERVQAGHPLTAGDLQTDGLLAMVRISKGKVSGFVLGEGTYLRWHGQSLVQSPTSVNVSVGAGDHQIAGRMRTRQALPPEPPHDVSIAALP